MCQEEKTFIEINALINDTRCSLQRNKLLTRLTTLVRFNSRQNCICGTLRTHVQTEILQRNLALGCLNLQPSFMIGYQMFDASQILECGQGLRLAINHMSRSRYSISSSINSDVSFLTHQQAITSVSLMMTTNFDKGPYSLVNLSDRLCSQFKSLLSNLPIPQPLVQAMETSRHHFTRYLSSLLHNTRSNSFFSKLSISVTVVPDGVPVDIDQLNGFFDDGSFLRHQDSITSLLHLPSVDTVNNMPITVYWTMTLQSAPLLQAVSCVMLTIS